MIKLKAPEIRNILETVNEQTKSALIPTPLAMAVGERLTLLDAALIECGDDNEVEVEIETVKFPASEVEKMQKKSAVAWFHGDIRKLFDFEA